MDKHVYVFNEIKMNLKVQIEILRNTKAVCTTMLNQAIANLNSFREELQVKEFVARALDQGYKIYMAGCKKAC